MGLRKRQAAAAAVILIHYKQQKKRKRRWWVRPWLARRNAMGAYNNLMREISLEDPQQFRIFLRMTTDSLEEILRLVGPLISKKDATMREAISAKERLAVTLRFLATGKFVVFFLSFLKYVEESLIICVTTGFT